MDIATAVMKAKEGSQESFTYLYETTYQRSYYVALKYMKNEQSAQDVLQTAYIKAFQNITKLGNPDKFSPWMSRIVATVALNELRKVNPILFSETVNEDEGDISDTLKDEKIENQPELSLDQRETSRLVQEIISDLNDEQRICITMFYMDEMSVKEMAKILKVSENTVKSRLNYGRQKIKKKVEELEKNGTNLLGVAPFIFFMLLFKTDAKACQCQIPAPSGQLSNYVIKKQPETPKVNHADKKVELTPKEKKESASQNATAKASPNVARKTAEQVMKKKLKMIISYKVCVIGAVVLAVVSTFGVVEIEKYDIAFLPPYQYIGDEGLDDTAYTDGQLEITPDTIEDVNSYGEEEKTATEDVKDEPETLVRPKIGEWQQVDTSNMEGDGMLFEIFWDEVPGADAYEVREMQVAAERDENGNLIFVFPEETTYNNVFETTERMHHVGASEPIYTEVSVRAIRILEDGSKEYSDWSLTKSVYMEDYLYF